MHGIPQGVTIPTDTNAEGGGGIGQNRVLSQLLPNRKFFFQKMTEMLLFENKDEPIPVYLPENAPGRMGPGIEFFFHRRLDFTTAGVREVIHNLVVVIEYDFGTNDVFVLNTALKGKKVGFVLPIENDHIVLVGGGITGIKNRAVNGVDFAGVVDVVGADGSAGGEPTKLKPGNDVG